MASILVRARQVAFVGGAQRRPGEPPFVLDERSFNPDVFERVADEVPAESMKPAKQPKQPKQAKPNPVDPDSVL